MHATDAEQMTPRQRLDEIADILAEGFLRLRRRPGYVSDGQTSADPPTKNTFQAPPEWTGCPAASLAWWPCGYSLHLLLAYRGGPM
jgi:hypothetical protein